jgi:hypothetical protein
MEGDSLHADTHLHANDRLGLPDTPPPVALACGPQQHTWWEPLGA